MRSFLLTRKNMAKPGCGAVALLLVILAAAPAAAGTNYVALTGGSAPFNGTSWSNPFTNMQDALSAGTGYVVYVKGETFAITSQLSWTNSYVSVRGGYAGNGTPGDLTNTLTVLQGNGSTRIMLISGVTNGALSRLAIINGFVTSGNRGAGVNVLLSDLTIVDCLFSGNWVATTSNGQTPCGGALYAVDTALIVSNSTFTANRATGGGNWSAAGHGGAVYVSGESAIFVNSKFSRNQTTRSGGIDHGGALYLSTPSALIRNCLFWGNDSALSGDGIYVASGDVSVESCDLVLNAGYGIQRGGGTVVVTNSILWQNGVDADGTMTLDYCDVQNMGAGATTNNCLSADPKFERGLYLAANSPCVNRGSDLASNLGLTNLTTRADGTLDTGVVDLGYHFANGIDPAASDLYVLGTGSDATGDGSQGNPYRSITKALSLQDDGTRIHIGAGDYANGLETMPLDITKAGVQLLGTNATVTLLDGQGAKRVLQMSGNYGGRIEGVAIVNGYLIGGGGQGAGVHVSLSDLTVVDCLLSNNWVATSGNGQAPYGGAVYAVNSTLTVSNSAFTADRGTGGGNWSAGGRGGSVYVSGGWAVFVNSRFFGNWTTRSSTDDYGGALYLTTPSALIRNCLFWGNDSVRYGDGIHVNAGDVSVANVTVAGNGGEGIRRAGGTVTVKDSILWGNVLDAVGTMALSYCDVSNANVDVTLVDCLSLDPMFVNTAAGDYHEKSRAGSWHNGTWTKDLATSPCIDAGDPGSGFTFEPAPNGSHVNMGAYGNTVEASKSRPSGTVVLFR